MRFDDSLRTVLAADATSAFGAQSAFRQLVDLIGRGRVSGDPDVMARLRDLRPLVPLSVRAASARALTLSTPSRSLVEFFAEDDPVAAAAILRTARLADEDWLALLPKLGPAGRAILRSRGNLTEGVIRGLEAFGPTDFTLGHISHERSDVSFAERIDPRPSTEMPAAQAIPRSRPEPPPAGGQTFEISELVQRIETFHRGRERVDPPARPRPERLSFETDARGLIRWVDGSRRAGLIGRSLVPSSTDARGRASFRFAGGDGPDDGWRISAVPVFAPGTGHFTGYRGLAEQSPPPSTATQAIEPEALRRLVHELRTPTNAIAGFAELIATEMLGSAPLPHRTRAATIGREVAGLIGAIDDLDLSARMDVGALTLAPQPIEVGPALAAAVDRAAAAGRLRLPDDAGHEVFADEHALDQLLTRLAEAAAAGVRPGEAEEVSVCAGMADVAIAWPWTGRSGEASLLGTDFSLRFAHKLADALGGRLTTQPRRLTLHLPASFNAQVQATTH